MQDYLIIGQIIKPQGVKGEIKVKVLSEDENRFLDLKTVYIKEKDSYKPLEVLDSDTRGEFAYITIAGVCDRNEAEKYRNMFLYIDRENALKLEDGRYFICDLIGIDVYTEKDEHIGTLTDILQNGGADVYVVKGNKQLMFPALKRLIIKTDIASKKIIVDSEVLSEVAVYEN